MIKNALIALGLVLVGSVGLVAALPQTASAADPCADKSTILTIRPWFTNLTDANCNIKPIGSNGVTLQQFVSTVIVNIVDMLLQLVAYIAVGFVIWGGFIYLTSGGSPDKAANGQKTVMNALIGVVVAIASVGLVRLVGEAIL